MRTGKIYDLTATMSPRTPRSSDHPPVAFPPLRYYSRDGISTRTVSASLHAGTHLDAPSMYHPGGATVDQIPLDRLQGEAVIVDVPSENWFAITPDLLDQSPEPIRADDIVVLRTGWSAHTDDESRYILQSPGLTKAGVDWLIDRGIKLIASDSPSPEHVFMRSSGWRKLRPDLFGEVEIDPEWFPAHYGHMQFLGNGICLLEGLGGELGAVTGRRVELMALPMKYGHVEAAPARVVAWA